MLPLQLCHQVVLRGFLILEEGCSGSGQLKHRQIGKFSSLDSDLLLGSERVLRRGGQVTYSFANGQSQSQNQVVSVGAWAHSDGGQ